MKRLIGAVLVAAMLVLFAACASNPVSTSSAPTATAAPTTSSTSRNVRSEPVAVSETYAKVDVVSGTTPKPAATAAPSDTPATGDFPLVYCVGALGLILVCSGGLLLLRRI